MNLPNIKDLVGAGKTVTFVRYQSDALWYKCEDGFEFPVPIDDTGDAAFLPEDKAIIFMRWIRKHLSYLAKAVEDSTQSQVGDTFRT